MRDLKFKKAVISSLAADPDFSALQQLQALNSFQKKKFLQWLDQSGLSLYFLNNLQKQNALAVLPVSLRQELELRLMRNRERAQDMLSEFHRLNEAFDSGGVPAIALKGFTLVPDFCSDIEIRHQTDFDFLVGSESVEAAAAALQSCGYSTGTLNKSGESCFTTPLQHVPSTRDDIYAIQKQRQVDLHTSLWEETRELRLNVPEVSMEDAQQRRLGGVTFHSLSMEDAFLLQTLHAFKHTQRSWLRLSWLLEIDHFIRLHKEDSGLWSRIRERAGNSTRTHQAVAFVIVLTHTIFRGPLPRAVEAFCMPSLSEPIRTWVQQFGLRWAVADHPGSLLNLMVNREFISDPSLKKQYVMGRFFPSKGRFSIGAVQVKTNKMWFRAKAEQLSYAAFRIRSHVRGIFELPYGLLQWNRAVRTRRVTGTSKGL